MHNTCVTFVMMLACMSSAGCAMEMGDAEDLDVAGSSEALYKNTLQACLEQKYDDVKEACCGRFSYSSMMERYCAGNAVANCQDGHFGQATGDCRDAIDSVRVCAGANLCGGSLPPLTGGSCSDPSCEVGIDDAPEEVTSGETDGIGLGGVTERAY